MCYHYKPASKKEAKQLSVRFNAEVKTELTSDPKIINGFTHPEMPVIIDSNISEIVNAKWGLIPGSENDDKAFYKRLNTLNAKIETVDSSYTYKKYTENRCLILAESFKEWKHETISGKVVKVPYIITAPGGLFAMAGLYSVWNGQPTFTILTAPANELMSQIHNSAKRMPVILLPQEEKLWLGREPLAPYHIRTEVELIASPELPQAPDLALF